MKQGFTTLLAFTLAVGWPGHVAAATVVVPAGTGVIVKQTEKISSATHKKGDAVKMEVVQDVYVNGQKIIAAGAPVNANVKDVAKRFIAGVGGYLMLEVTDVKTISGTMVPLKFTEASSGKANIWSIICTVVCCCFAIFIPGEDVSLEAGKLYNTTTASNVEVQI